MSETLRLCKDIVKIALVAASVGGCTLRLCEEGAALCRYGLTDSCEGGMDECLCKLGEDDNCIENFTSDPIIKACDLFLCKGDEWIDMQKVCENGFEKRQCTAECTSDATRCVSQESQSEAAKGESCQFQICKAQKWTDVEYCTFGKDGNGCKDPCILNEHRFEYLSGDDGVVFKCTKQSGWEIDNSCTSDFSFEDSSAEMRLAKQVDIPQYLLAESLREKIANGAPLNLNGRNSGVCGVCSQDKTPTFYTAVEDQCIVHWCHNGIVKVEPTDNKTECDADIHSACLDAYNQTIFIDTSSNRYHCGGCGNECASNQVCDNENCRSSVECVGGYATFQVGARLIRAFCIEKVDDFSSIMDGSVRDNYDNAFVLVNDIELDENWIPIGTSDKKFSGLFLGNGRKITLKYNGSLESASLFGEVENAFVSDLSLKLKNVGSTSVPVSGLKNSHFGILARSAINSRIDDVYVDFDELRVIGNDADKTDFDLSLGGIAGELKGSNIDGCGVSGTVGINLGKGDGKFFYVGGIAGYAQDYSIRDCVIAASITGLYAYNENEHGIGGLVGRSLDLVSVENIRTKDSDSVVVSGYKNVGGIIGFLEQRKRKGTISEIQTKNDLTGYVQNLGGISGNVVINSDLEKPALQVSGIDVHTLANLTDGLYSKLIIDPIKTVIDYYKSETQGTVTNEETENSPHQAGRYARRIGGLFGRIGLESEKIELNRGVVSVFDAEVFFGLADKTNVEKIANSEIGGVSGYSAHTNYQKINVKWETSAFENAFSMVGEIIGNAVDVSCDSCVIDELNLQTNKLNLSTYFGGFFGYSVNSSVTDCQVGNKNEKIRIDGVSLSGGMAGRSRDDSFLLSKAFNVQISGSIGLGGLLGRSDNSRIEKTEFLGNENQILSTESPIDELNLFIEQNPNAKSIGGLIGVDSGSQLVSIQMNLCQLDAEDANDLNAGGVLGYAHKTQVDTASISLADCTDQSRLKSKYAVGAFIGAAMETNLSNIRVESVSLESIDGGRYAGGLIGVDEGSVIENSFYSFTTGFTVKGQGTADGQPGGVGGLIGSAKNTSIRGFNFGSEDNGLSVQGTGNNVGGMIGTDNNSIIQNDNEVFFEKIEGHSKVGGLIGESSATQIDSINLYAQEVTANDKMAGGLIGYSKGVTKVKNTKVNYGSITGVSSVGGLIGESSGTTIESVSVTGTAVSATDTIAGGLIGKDSLSSIHGDGISADGNVQVFSDSIEGKSDVGGLIGYAESTIIDSVDVIVKNIEASESIAGGIIGEGTGLISLSKSMVQARTISSVTQVGGLIGLYRESLLLGLIWDISMCGVYATLKTTGTGAVVGGIIGELDEFQLAPIWDPNIDDHPKKMNLSINRVAPPLTDNALTISNTSGIVYFDMLSQEIRSYDGTFFGKVGINVEFDTSSYIVSNIETKIGTIIGSTFLHNNPSVKHDNYMHITEDITLDDVHICAQQCNNNGLEVVMETKTYGAGSSCNESLFTLQVSCDSGPTYQSYDFLRNKDDANQKINCKMEELLSAMCSSEQCNTFITSIAQDLGNTNNQFACPFPAYLDENPDNMVSSTRFANPTVRPLFCR